MLNPKVKTDLWLDLIHTALYESDWLDRIAVHHSLRDARQRLSCLEGKIHAGETFTAEEHYWLKWFFWLAFQFVRTGELPGRVMKLNGAYSYVLPGSEENPEITPLHWRESQNLT